MKLVLKRKNFSIQSGHPDKGGSLGREMANRTGIGAAAGGILGATMGVIPSIAVEIEHGGSFGLGAFGGVTAGSAAIGAIIGCLSSLGANSRKAKAELMTMDDIIEVLYGGAYQTDDYGERYDEFSPHKYIVKDGDPRQYMATFAFEDGKGVIWLNKPTNTALKVLNDSLETMIKYNRKGDYASQEIKEGYVVEVICPNRDSFAGIIYDFIHELKVKVSCVTNKMLDRERGLLKTKRFD